MSAITILGIETSCDETAAAVLRLEDGRPRVLSDVVLGQAVHHAPYRGVVPEIAARAHVEGLDTDGDYRVTPASQPPTGDPS